MSFLQCIDETAVKFVDECIELQDILTNLDKMDAEKAFQKVSGLSFFENEDGITTIVENITCLLRIRPNYTKYLANFCIVFIDKANLGHPSSAFGELLLDSLLSITSEDFYISKVPDFVLLYELCAANIFSSSDYLPTLTHLYTDNFYNQFALMFLFMAQNLEVENPKFYDSVFPVLKELVNIGVIFSDLLPYINCIEELRSNEWSAVRTGVRNERDQKIVDSLRNDDVRALRMLKVDPNMQITYTLFEPCDILSNDPTLLQIAAFYKAHNCFLYLHNEGAKMHRKDSHGNTLTMYVAAGGDERIVKSIKRLNLSFKKTLSFAAAHRNYDLLEWIIEKRSKDVGNLDREMRNVMTASAKFNNFRTFMGCLERGQNPKNRDRNNMNSLLLSTKWRYYHFAQFVTLFDSVNLNSVDDNGATPLHYAAKNNDCSMISLLIDDNAKVNIRDNNGLTPFHYAAQCGHVEAVEMLLPYSSSIDVVDKMNRTPLHYACINDFGPVVSFLLEHGSTKTIKDSEGKIPIQYCKDAEVAKLLINKKC